MDSRAIQVYEGGGDDPTGTEKLELAFLPPHIRTYLDNNNNPTWTVQSYCDRECEGVRWLELNDPAEHTMVQLNQLMNIVDELQDLGVDSFTRNWPLISPRLDLPARHAQGLPPETFPGIRVIGVKKLYIDKKRNRQATADLVYSLTYRR